MRSAALALLLAFAVASAAIEAGEAGRDMDISPSARPKLLLREDFNGSQLERGRWNTCHWWDNQGCTISSNNELEWYLPEQVRVGRGALRLVAARRSVLGSDGQTYPYVSGMVSSGPPYDSAEPKFAFRYGKAKIRARAPAGRGLWPAFWLLPASGSSKPEIDVMEIIGQRPQTVQMFLHYQDRNGEVRRRGAHFTDRGLRSGWHTFAIDWRPRKLVWLIDGVPRFRVTGAPVPRERMYLVANLAVGGEGPGPPAPSTPFPSRFKIDYVKVQR
jgi:beta-glucanase (GH16 family)